MIVSPTYLNSLKMVPSKGAQKPGLAGLHRSGIEGAKKLLTNI